MNFFLKKINQFWRFWGWEYSTNGHLAVLHEEFWKFACISNEGTGRCRHVVYNYFSVFLGKKNVCESPCFFLHWSSTAGRSDCVTGIGTRSFIFQTVIGQQMRIFSLLGLVHPSRSLYHLLCSVRLLCLHHHKQKGSTSVLLTSSNLFFCC